jgi:drug/metabolite transporter superfamily protein YnfA
MDKLNLPVVAWLVFLGAAILEVGGDALVRRGLKGEGWYWIVAGCLGLATYGVVVNLVPWDFSKLLGVYVAVFAVVAVSFGRFIFQEDVPWTTWIGLGVILIGAGIIQFGNR